MEWFYVNNGQQAGPVDEDTFNELIASGEIQADTLVWNEGLDDWQPCNQTVAGQSLEDPGETFPLVSDFAGTGLVYGGFWIRTAAVFLDGLILQFLTLLPALVIGGHSFIYFFMAMAYETYMLGRFGATVGKMALRMRVVQPDGSPLSYQRALGRYFGRIASYMIFMIGFIMAAFDREKRALHDHLAGTRVIKI